jgi:hypothetical protein
VPLFILAGGELVLLFLGARIAWWVLRTRADDAEAAPPRAPTGGGATLRALRPGSGARAGVESLREAA